MPTSVRPTPSLRVEEFAVQGFRTIRDRVVVPCRVGRRPAEPIVPVHGESSTGKTNLLAALGAFFRGADLCLNASSGVHELQRGGRAGQRGPITWRDRFRTE